MNELDYSPYKRPPAEEAMWAQFHVLWSKEKNYENPWPEYDKKAWIELETRMFAALKEARGK